MTDWTTIPNDVIEAGKPGRAVDGRALRDNPVAIAEGAPGAPGVSPTAFIDSITVLEWSGRAHQTVLGLGGTKWLRFELYGNWPGTSEDLEIRFSTDGGVTWSGFMDLVNDRRGQLSCRIMINLETGNTYADGTFLAWVDDKLYQFHEDLTLTLPAGRVDAIQLRHRERDNSISRIIMQKVCGYKAA
ncbi:hypothetical protein NHU_00028 [Rhodovulum sulfidophilum]|uniref:Uncharacterized protein n=1 Tax=Rhodovulum sulfidophilum TaxID=35806 RepID=A0A0D6AX76_RHOSU|nr:hypothetical protein NHU_00028 [Rhodovulum sulfidophilum]